MATQAEIAVLRGTATQVKNESQVGGNTAGRVGGLFEGIVDALPSDEAIDGKISEAVADIQPIVIEGNVDNAPDQEDLTSVNQGGTDVLKFKDKTYAPALFSGLGRVYLRKNVVTPENLGYSVNLLTAEMVAQENTIYHIQYDYNLNGQTITLPAGCVLEFEGGSVKNGTINGTSTRITAEQVEIFGDSLVLSGTWDVDMVFPQWWGAKADKDNLVDDTDAFQKAFDNTFCGNIVIPKGVYYIAGTLVLKGRDKQITAYGAYLYHGGNSHFVKVGVGSSSADSATSVVIEGGRWFHSLDYYDQTHPNVNGDTFHFVYGENITFRNMRILGGRNGINCGDTDFIGFYNGLFENVHQSYAAENGIYFNAIVGSTQCNAIVFIKTTAATNGTPSTTIDATNGNGFVLSGVSFSLYGCNAEINAGFGIKIPDDTLLQGCVITGIHFENCLNGSIYIGRSTPSYRKLNIFVSSLYTNSRTGALVNNNNSVDARKENIVVVQDEKQVEPSKFGAMENTTFYLAKSILEQQKLPCVIEYQPSQVYTFNPYLTIRMLIKGEAFEIVRKGVPHLVSAVSGTTITIDDTFTIANKKVMVINKNHPCWAFGKSLIMAHPIYASVAKFQQSVNKSIGGNQVTLLQTTIDNVGGITAGDILVEYDNNEYSYANPNTHTQTTMPLTSADKSAVFAMLPKEYQNIPDYIPIVLGLLNLTDGINDAVLTSVATRSAKPSTPLDFGMQRLIPSGYTGGATGKIPNIEANTYLFGFNAANYYNANNTTCTLTNGVVEVSSTSAGYGVGFIIAATEGACYAASYKCSNLYRVDWAFYDKDGNFISNKLTSEAAQAPTGAKFAICVFCSNANDTARISDIYVGAI